MKGLMHTQYADVKLRRPGVVGADRALAGPSRAGIAPQTVHLLLYQGDTFDLTLVVADPDGQPADLTAMTASAQIRRTPNDPVMAEFDANTAGDTIILYLSHEAATGLVPGRAVWDCQIAGYGRVTTLCAGNVTVLPEVTRNDAPAEGVPARGG